MLIWPHFYLSYFEGSQSPKPHWPFTSLGLLHNHCLLNWRCIIWWYSIGTLPAMESFPFLCRVKTVNQAPMVSQENAVLLVHKALLDRGAYLESLAEMWVTVLDLPASLWVTNGTVWERICFKVLQAPFKCLMGRWYSHARCCLCCTFYYLWTMSVSHLKLNKKLHCTYKAMHILRIFLWASSPSGILPFGKLFDEHCLSLLENKLSSSLWTNCITLFFQGNPGSDGSPGRDGSPGGKVRNH